MPIDGLEEVLAQLETLPDRIMAGAAKGVANGATRIRDSARKKAPVDQGDLRKMISYDVEAGGNGIVGTVIAAAEHSPYVEFGTGPRGQESYTGDQAIAYNQGMRKYRKGRLAGREIYHRGQPAQPFLYPAAMENKDAVRDDIAAGILEELL